MGYSANTTKVDLIIRAENLPLAFVVLNELNKQDHLKRGGSSTGEKWFSFMNHWTNETCKNAGDVIQMLGFNVKYNEAGDLILGHYEDEKVGQEELFFEYLAPLVRYGSVVVWRGEDGSNWRWYFDGKELHIEDGTVVYESDLMDDEEEWELEAEWYEGSD